MTPSTFAAESDDSDDKDVDINRVGKKGPHAAAGGDAVCCHSPRDACVYLQRQHRRSSSAQPRLQLTVRVVPPSEVTKKMNTSRQSTAGRIHSWDSRGLKDDNYQPKMC